MPRWRGFFTPEADPPMELPRSSHTAAPNAIHPPLGWHQRRDLLNLIAVTQVPEER